MSDWVGWIIVAALVAFPAYFGWRLALDAVDEETDGGLSLWSLSYRLGPFSRYRFHQINADGYTAGVKWSRGKQPPGGTE